MITAGVDLSSQIDRTAACLVDWSVPHASVTALALGVDDDTIARLMVTVVKLGIDVPFGWPTAFVDAVAQHSRDGSWPADYLHDDNSALRYRRTDLWVWKTLKTRPPLSVSSDRIALPAMRAAALFSRQVPRVALDGSGILVEVYPAAALRRWGLPSQQYKGKDYSDARRALVERFLEETAGWLSVRSDHVELCLSSDDALDALIAALVARAAAVALVEPVPNEDQAVAVREGWIAVPCLGSLSLLAGVETVAS